MGDTTPEVSPRAPLQDTPPRVRPLGYPQDIGPGSSAEDALGILGLP